jgi:hypothetical protein
MQQALQEITVECVAFLLYIALLSYHIVLFF